MKKHIIQRAGKLICITTMLTSMSVNASGIDAMINLSVGVDRVLESEITVNDSEMYVADHREFPQIGNAAKKLKKSDETSILKELEKAEQNRENIPFDSVLGSFNKAEEENKAFMANIGVGAVLDAAFGTNLAYSSSKEKSLPKVEGYTNLGIANVGDHLNIRTLPQEDGRIVGKLPQNAACEIISEENGWANIQSGEVEGYVKSEFLLTDNAALAKAEKLLSEVALVEADALKIRTKPSTDSEIVDTIAYGSELEVIEEDGDWLKVEIDNTEAYVAAEYVKVESKLQQAMTMTEILYGEGISDVRAELCQYAKQFVGNPYVWGGTSLTKGADCSGFVLSVYKKFGISMDHSSRAQANYGTKVSVSEAKPGDLFFYGNGRSVNHVAIYIGGGQVVHASSVRTGIKISNATYRTPVAVKRVLQV